MKRRSGMVANPQLRPHLAVLVLIAAGTALLGFRPQVILHAGYRCELQTLLGIRCPFCGMTRDFAAMLHGRSALLNPCSRVAAVVVYVLYPCAVLVAWARGRLEWFQSDWLRYGAGAALCVMMVVNNWH